MSWPENVFRLFQTMVPENPNELFGQPNIEIDNYT